MDFKDILARRLRPRPVGRWDVHSRLKHFALINYALPKSRLERYIPAERFEIPEFEVGGERRALMSAVPFLDVDFHFARLLPFVHLSFGQTNYRVYVTDRATGEHAVWFFGTTLGSPVVQIPRRLWRLPWYYARYRVNCQYDAAARRYLAYRYTVRSRWGSAEINLEDTGESVREAEGFSSADELKLILTHPIDGYFYRLDGRVGKYSVWHEEIPVTAARVGNLYFSLYEDLGLLSRDEMRRPHSVFLCPETEFRIFLPPRAIG